MCLCVKKTGAPNLKLDVGGPPLCRVKKFGVCLKRDYLHAVTQISALCASRAVIEDARGLFRGGTGQSDV